VHWLAEARVLLVLPTPGIKKLFFRRNLQSLSR
jgi:hypothetical protein